MIAKMKKLTFLVYHKEYDAFLEELRQVGVVHVVKRQCGEMDARLQQLTRQWTLCKKVLADMQTVADGYMASSQEGEPEAILSLYDDYQKRRQELEAKLPQLDKNIALLEPWGNFDYASVQRLKEVGWNLHFFICPEADYQDEWAETCNAIRIHEHSGNVYFVTLTKQVDSPLELEPVRLPLCGLAEAENQKAEVQRQLDVLQQEFRQFCADSIPVLKDYSICLQNDIDLLEVKLDGEQMADGSVLLLEGWVPEEEETKVRQMLDRSSVHYQVRAAQKEDKAPIKLKNNAFVRLYEVLTKMYGMPDYAEFDPTPLIAPFFSIFFAFCMGDAGYGLILIALGFVLKKKMSVSMAGMMNLVISLGVFTTVIGAIFGTFFGVSLFDADIPQWMKQFMIAGKIEGTTYDKQMVLALLLGVVHICIAMTVKAISSTVRFGFKNSLSNWGWLLLVVGFISVGGLSFFEVISPEVSYWAYIIIGGVAAIGIYLLNTWGRNVLVNIGSGIWDTYNMATGLMGDVLSYLRLFALGLAGGMLGGAFNQLAFMVNDAAGPAIGWLPCGLILIAGHSLNVAMSCLSAFVHPIRLTFMEFFKNSGYEGTGEQYAPFAVVKSEKETNN